MNLNRLRPIGIAKENLDLWLSSVINDAVRDAVEAGLPREHAYQILKAIAQTEHPLGYNVGKKEVP